MPTYISLVNYTEQGIRNIKEAPKRIDAVRQMVKDAGGELRAIYLTMGQYDLVTIVEAPNDEVVAKTMLTIGSAGNVRTTTMRAFPEADFRTIVRSLA